MPRSSPGTPTREPPSTTTGDLVLAIDGATLGDAQSLQKRLFADAIGQRMEVTVMRNGALVDAVVLPSELPD